MSDANWNNGVIAAPELSSASHRLNLLARDLRSSSTHKKSAKESTMAADRGPLTTHVLDTSSGKPASGLRLELYDRSTDPPQLITSKVTSADGRVERIVDSASLQVGTYTLRFYSDDYFRLQDKKCFYPYCDVTFHVDDECSAQHLHVPLLLSPYGYSTYRGS